MANGDFEQRTKFCEYMVEQYYCKYSHCFIFRQGNVLLDVTFGHQ